MIAAGTSTADAKREIIDIMLANIFATAWARQLHYDTRHFLAGRLFFRCAP